MSGMSFRKGGMLLRPENAPASTRLRREKTISISFVPGFCDGKICNAVEASFVADVSNHAFFNINFGECFQRVWDPKIDQSRLEIVSEAASEPQDLSERTKIHILQLKIAQISTQNTVFETSGLLLRHIYHCEQIFAV